MSEEAFNRGARLRLAVEAFLERFLPLVGCLVVSFSKHCFLPTTFPVDLTNLLATSANVAGVAVGFLATGQALLYSISDNSLVIKLKAMGYFQPLVRMFTAAISWNLIFLLSTVGTYWVKLPEKPLFLSLWCGFAAGAFLSTILIVSRFWLVLHRE